MTEADEIGKLAKLKADGAISDQEYEQLKNKYIKSLIGNNQVEKNNKNIKIYYHKGLKPIEAYKLAILRFWDFEGRSTRSEYFYFILLNYFILTVLIILFFIGSNWTPKHQLSLFLDFTIFVFVCTMLVVAVMSVSLHVRRLHDLNLSGWWLIPTVIPYLNIVAEIVLFLLFCTRGTDGNNRFGPDPLQSHENTIEEPISEKFKAQQAADELGGDAGQSATLPQQKFVDKPPQPLALAAAVIIDMFPIWLFFLGGLTALISGNGASSIASNSVSPSQTYLNGQEALQQQVSPSAPSVGSATTKNSAPPEAPPHFTRKQYMEFFEREKSTLPRMIDLNFKRNWLNLEDKVVQIDETYITGPMDPPFDLKLIKKMVLDRECSAKTANDMFEDGYIIEYFLHIQNGKKQSRFFIIDRTSCQ